MGLQSPMSVGKLDSDVVGEGSTVPESVPAGAAPGMEEPPPKTFTDIFQKARSKTKPAENVSSSESKFTCVPEDITPWEKRKLLGLALEIGVRATMRNHIYTFGGQDLGTDRGRCHWASAHWRGGRL